MIVTPILLVIGIFIAIEDGFPIFYTPLRGGYHGKPFHIIKLRTMYKGADKLGGTTALNDPRITRAGRLLRKVKLDELPQLYNVLLGSMSFVGPRPELLRYTEAYEGEEKQILRYGPASPISAPSSLSVWTRSSARKTRMKCMRKICAAKEKPASHPLRAGGLPPHGRVSVFQDRWLCAEKALRIARAGNGEKA